MLLAAFSLAAKRTVNGSPKSSMVTGTVRAEAAGGTIVIAIADSTVGVTSAPFINTFRAGKVQV